MKEKKYFLYEMDMTVLNIFSIVLLLVMVLITLLLYRVQIIQNTNYHLGFIFALMVPYLCIHEIFHSIAYVLHGADFKNITYGAHIEKGVLCCLCKQNINKKNILISLIYPFVFLGVITYIVGVYLDSPLLIALSVINISGCAGDLIMFMDFLKIKNFEYSEFDNPTAFGLYMEESTPIIKMFGLKYIKKLETLEIKDFKKISISKASIIFFIAIFLMALIWMFM